MITINIVNGNNTVAWTPKGDVTLSAGSHASYGVNTRGTVRAMCDIPGNWRETFYGSMKECIEGSQSGMLYNAGSPYPVDFQPQPGESGKGYYVTKINDTPGVLGSFDVVGGSNIRWAPASAGLTIADMARPDIECLDYVRIAGYITKLNEEADRIIAQIGNVPSSTSTNPEYYGLWRQYQATRELWNYLVIRSMVVFSMEHQGNRLFVKARFNNLTGVTIPVGNLMIGFQPCQYNGLFYKAWSNDDKGNGLDWTTSSAKYQNMATGSWTVSPSTTCSVDGGGYVEVTAVFLMFNTTLRHIYRTISRDIAPWVDKLPSISSGRVTSAGWLSWERPHFNPTTYGNNPPAGLPPTGDGCVYKRSSGNMNAEWMTTGAISSTRPALHIDLYCKNDRMYATFRNDFDISVVPETEDPTGTFDYEITAIDNYVPGDLYIRWTPTGGSAVRLFRISMLGEMFASHFHKGDHIFIDIPEGWCDPVSASNVNVSCIWDIPINACIVDAAKAGGSKIMPIFHDEARKKSVPARNGDNDYAVEQIRSIVLHNE